MPPDVGFRHFQVYLSAFLILFGAFQGPLVPELLFTHDQHRALGHAELLVVGGAVELEPRCHHLRKHPGERGPSGR